MQSSWCGLHRLAVTGERHHGHAELVVHAPQEHVAPIGKTPGRRRGAVVPLAGEKGPVARPREGLGPGVAAPELLVDAEERPAGEHHRAAGHADGPLHAAHAVGTVAHRAPRDERIDRGRSQVGIAKGRDRVSPLVVGEKHEHARRPRPLCQGRAGQQQRRQRDAAEEQAVIRVSDHARNVLPARVQTLPHSPPRSLVSR